jgi:ligand-binding sensor domain-containing protein
MKKVLGLYVLILTAAVCSGQSPYFQSYFPLRKNESVQINKIFQDHTGFIWFATNKGLFKHDGKNYQRFTVADSLPDNNVTALAEDSTGKIWIGHRNGQLAYFENGKIKKFITNEGPASGEISDILFDAKGNLWFSTLNDGLYYYTSDRLYRLDDVEGLPDLFIYDLIEDKDGNIWAGTDGGAAKCILIEKKVKIEVLNYKNGLPDNIVKKLAIANDNTLWLATEDAGILQYDQHSKKITPMIKSGWSYGSVSDFVLKNNKVWISSPAMGLYVFDLSTQQIKLYSAQTQASFTSIRTLLADYEGNIWAGTKSGILRTQGDGLEFISSLDPAIDKNVLAVTVDKANNIWFSNSEGLFKKIFTTDGHAEITKIPLGSVYQKSKIISLYVDDAGYVWAGLYGEGALRIHPTNGEIKILTKELRNGNVLGITGKGNTVWLATLGGSTQITYSGEQLSIKNFSNEEGLVSDFIYQVFVDSQDRVWFATDGKGISMLDKDGFHHFEKGLATKVVYGFAEDQKKNIWVNVQGSGLYSFDGNAFTALPSSLKLRDNNLHCLSTDRDGNLVVMHDLGMDVYDIKKNKIRYLGDDVGLRDMPANLNAASKDAQGNIYIGTNSGIIIYSTEQSGNQPKSFINSFKVFDKPVNILENSQLKYDQDNITISYTGFWYQSPNNLFYKYMLENYDRDWITTRDQAVTYSQLPPGDYVFHVKASDTEDFADNKETIVKFSISPPFWRTYTFYAVVLIFFIAAAYAFIKFRERQFLLDKLELETKVEQRTRELQIKTEEIQAQNEEIMAQAEEIKGINDNLEMLVNERTAELEKKNAALEEYAFINAHKLRSPLASILGLINLITKTESPQETKEITRRLQNAADDLDNVVHSITKAIERGE